MPTERIAYQAFIPMCLGSKASQYPRTHSEEIGLAFERAKMQEGSALAG
jgi:hypothetical protein